jgi:hypothetical protein
MTLLAALSTTGCGDDSPTEREYALPETLCGLDVPKDLYDPLFPPGSDVKVEGFPGLPYLSADRCHVSVDGEEAILADTGGEDSFQGYMDGVGRHYDYDMDDGTPVEGEFEAMAWPGFVVAGTSCRPGAIIDSFTVGIVADYPEDDEESVRVLSDLIQPFTRAAVDNSQCEPGNNPRSDYSSP